MTNGTLTSQGGTVQCHHVMDHQDEARPATDEHCDAPDGTATAFRLAEAPGAGIVDAIVSRSRLLGGFGRFAGGVAHDVNNLLGVILNYTALVLMQTTSDAARDDIEQIRAAAERAVGVTQQLLTLGCQDGSDNAEQLDLNANIAQISRLLAGSLGGGVDLAVHASVEPASVHADRGKIDQVLVNLILNARDAMPDGGTVTIETRLVHLDEHDTHQTAEAGGATHVELSVRDSGDGMSPDVAAQAFEPFYTTKPHGCGLGLATVERIVTEAGGAVTVSSMEGLGTTFTVHLPWSGAAQSPPLADRGGCGQLAEVRVGRD
ncbi:MAG: putative multi-sensor signal transduction histidine kinase [Acidimicrobiales bacterium]|nr:putative multi-sensor signal transduction histidine kinase [Acidimicrobiales bacterium]